MQNNPPTEEWFDVVDRADQVIGKALRREVHAKGLLHRAVHILVNDRRGHVFLQKRSMLKDVAPGTWDSSASGHLDSGEDYDTACVRELREEIGLVCVSTPRRVLRLDACPETGNEFLWIYRLESEGPFVLHPQEIDSGEWFEPAELTRMIAARPQEFAESFRFIWERLASQFGG